MTQAVEIHEGIEPVFTFQPGNEVRVAGRWLEVITIKQSLTHSVVTCYDEEENRHRSFAATADAERRVRQVIA